MGLEFEQGLSLIKTALKRYRESMTEERTWQLYLIQYQHMTPETFRTYEEFKGRSENKVEKTAIDIIKETRNLYYTD